MDESSEITILNYYLFVINFHFAMRAAAPLTETQRNRKKESNYGRWYTKRQISKSMPKSNAFYNFPCSLVSEFVCFINWLPLITFVIMETIEDDDSRRRRR